MQIYKRFLLHAFALLVAVVCIGWVAKNLGLELFSTTSYLLASGYLLIVHWKDRAARFITMMFTAMMLANVLGTWFARINIYTFLVYGTIFDLTARWLFLHYDIVASKFKYPLPKGSNFFQVFALGRVFLASASYNLLLLIAYAVYFVFGIKYPSKLLYDGLAPVKITLSILVYLNIWSLLFDANSLKKLHQSTRENVA